MEWYTSTIRLISPTALLTTIDGEILHLPSLRRRPICGHHHHHHHHCVIIIIIIIIFIIIPPPTWGQFSKYLVASVFRLTLIKRFHRSTYIWRRSSFEHRYYFCYSLKGKQFFLHQWNMTNFIQNQSGANKWYNHHLHTHALYAKQWKARNNKTVFSVECW